MHASMDSFQLLIKILQDRQLVSHEEGIAASDFLNLDYKKHLTDNFPDVLSTQNS